MIALQCDISAECAEKTSVCLKCDAFVVVTHAVSHQ